MLRPSSSLLAIAAAVGTLLLLLFLLLLPGPRVRDFALPAAHDHHGQTPALAADASAFEGISEAPVDRHDSEWRQGVDVAALEGMCALEIVDERGAAVSEAPAVLWRDGAILHRGSSDDNGLIAVCADSETAELFLVAVGRPIFRREVFLEPGTHRIELPLGEVVAGSIRREGEELPEGVLIVLTSDHPLHPHARIPESVLDSLGVFTRADSMRLHWLACGDGTFRFTGLPAGWSGELRLPGAFNLAGASFGRIVANGQALRLERPVKGLQLTLRELLRVHGRLVSLDSGRPVAGVMLQLRYRPRGTESGTEAMGSRSSQSKDDGTFAFILPYASLEDLESLEVSLDGGMAPNPIFEARRVQLPAQGDLGDIEVAGLRDVSFRLLDQNDLPIAGGTAHAGPSWSSEPSDADGLCVLPNLPPAVQGVRILADGFLPNQVAIPAILLGPIEVHLLPANRLEVEVQPLPGTDLPPCSISLSHPERLLEPEEEGRDDVSFHIPGARRWSSLASSSGEVVHLTCEPDSASVAVFRALRPGVELQLEVVSTAAGRIFHSQAVAPLGATEARRVEVKIAVGGFPFRGRVVDAAGFPLVGATLRLGGETLGSTDETGTFQVPTWSTEAQSLLVQHETCASLYLEDYLVPRDGIPVEFRLERPHTVTIEVVGEDGSAVLGAKVSTKIHGFVTEAADLGAGRFQASHLPAGLFEIQTKVMGQSLIQSHNPAIPVARVVVPSEPAGSVRVELIGTRRWPASAYMLVLQPLPPNPAEQQRLASIRPEDGSFRFPSVPPGPYLIRLLGVSPPDKPGELEEVAEAELTVGFGQETRVELEVGQH